MNFQDSFPCEPFIGYKEGLTYPPVDWDYFITQRPTVLAANPDLTPYLLLPELEVLLKLTHNPIEHFLINTIMHTGLRTCELMRLKKSDFRIDSANYPYVQIAQAKSPGRPSNTAKNKSRDVPIFDGNYLSEVLAMLELIKGGRDKPIFSVGRQTMARWITKALDRVNKHGYSERGPLIPINVSLLTLRNSFAVNAVIHMVPVSTLREWMGHQYQHQTAKYYEVLSKNDSHYMARVTYHSGFLRGVIGDINPQ